MTQWQILALAALWITLSIGVAIGWALRSAMSPKYSLTVTTPRGDITVCGQTVYDTRQMLAAATKELA